jgi:hypothetical protein
LKDETFTITPTLKSQEVVNGIYGDYWDGSTTVTGLSPGRATVELLNYCFTP